MAPSSRESIYYLSALAEFLQNEGKGPEDIENELIASIRSPNTNLDTTRRSRARFVNHLSTLFTRGRTNDEASRIVVVAAGPPMLDKMSLVVTSCPTSTFTPTTSPIISPSTTTSAISLSRNSENNGSFKQEVIYPEDDFDSVLALALKIDKTSFEHYVTLSLRLLRSGAACIRASPSSASEIAIPVYRFFVQACFQKIKARFNGMKRHYPLDALRDWRPIGSELETIPSSEVKITHSAIQKLLVDAQGANNLFRFDSSTATLWWGALVELLLKMGQFVNGPQSNEDKADAVAALSEMLHKFITVIPSVFWRLPSLVVHLHNCRRSKPEHMDDEDEEEQVLGEALGPEKINLSNVQPEVRAFYHTLDAICAWTTGSRFLLFSSISKSKAPLYLAMVDLPREDVPVHSPEALAAHWKEIGKWDHSTHHQATENLQSIRQASFHEIAKRKEAAGKRQPTSDTVITEDAPETNTTAIPSTQGACHCEAGLVTSIFLRQQDIASKSLDEPLVLTDAFADLDVVAGHPFTIGVAKKCCPICKMLLDILRTENNFNVDIAGAHSRFRPWVPPKWLPSRVLNKLEEDLLKVVMKMMADRELFGGSRASSPASGRSTSEDEVYLSDDATRFWTS
ncbi:hypothetical protein K438DRAFT_1954988 [Mycena galopus ATCC 62051]|nr:hypothetical protein K438DRAFT_1954988 [Mycena galopus ATCC 62051]